MQSVLRSATRLAVGINGRRGVATTATATTKAATTAREAERDLVAQNEKAWVAALVQREVRAQMVAEEERRITRDRLRAAAEESAARCRQVLAKLEIYCACSGILGGCLLGTGLAMLMLPR